MAFDLASITEIKNEAGYLRNSVVMVKMEMRLKEEENESFLFFSEDNDTFAVGAFSKSQSNLSCLLSGRLEISMEGVHAL